MGGVLDPYGVHLDELVVQGGVHDGPEQVVRLFARGLLLLDREALPPLPYVSTRQLGHPKLTDTDLDDRPSLDRPPASDARGFALDVQLQQPAVSTLRDPGQVAAFAVPRSVLGDGRHQLGDPPHLRVLLALCVGLADPFGGWGPVVPVDEPMLPVQPRPCIAAGVERLRGREADPAFHSPNATMDVRCLVAPAALARHLSHGAPGTLGTSHERPPGRLPSPRVPPKVCAIYALNWRRHAQARLCTSRLECIKTPSRGANQRSDKGCRNVDLSASNLVSSAEGRSGEPRACRAPCQAAGSQYRARRCVSFPSHAHSRSTGNTWIRSSAT